MSVLLIFYWLFLPYVILYWLFLLALVGVPLYLLCRLMWAAIKKLEKP